MERAQTLNKEPWRKYSTNTSITVYNYLKIDGHTETPLVMSCISPGFELATLKRTRTGPTFHGTADTLKVVPS